MGSFNIGLTGLNAAAADLNVTGNNIANAETIGFKKSRAEFGDVFAQAYCYINRTATGSGVRLAATPQQFAQGSLSYTDNGLDMAVNGQGFFVLNGSDGDVYSRSGAFQVDNNGYVVNSQGLRLQAYPPNYQLDSTGDIIVDHYHPLTTNISGRANTQFNSTPGDVQVPMGDVPAVATSRVNMGVNLRADALPPLDSTGAVATFNYNDPTTYNYSSTTTVYDTLGSPHSMTLYYVKPGTPGVATPPLDWNVYTSIDGVAPGTAVTTTFKSDGTLDTPTTISVTAGPFASNGASIGAYDEASSAYTESVDISLAGMTQFGTEYSVSDISQNGYTSGSLTSVEVDQNGVLFTRYSNGQSVARGQVVLANFQNPQGLQVLGDNSWGETNASGQAVFDAPGSGELGTIQSGALEMSNVDLTEELVHLITAQRYFQANSQTISTADQMTQTIINLK